MNESLDSDEIQQLHTAIRLPQITITISHKDLGEPYQLYPIKNDIYIIWTGSEVSSMRSHKEDSFWLGEALMKLKIPLSQK